MQAFEHKKNLLGIFAQHRVAANLLMVIMLMSGVWALTKMNTQFLPNFALDFISVTVTWRGASTEDIETGITRPIEQELRSLEGVRKMNSTSAIGLSNILLEYEEGTDMGIALDRVNEKVSLIRNLPQTAEKPEISKIERYDLIGRVLITGVSDPSELRYLTRKMESDLLDRGISKIDITGLPEEEIAIQIKTATLQALGLTLPQIGQKIANLSRDLPAGSIGKGNVARQLRSLEQKRTEIEFAKLPIISDKSGRLIRLGDIAKIERRPRDKETRLTYMGQPAVELQLLRMENNDALKSAKIMQMWLEEARQQLPPNIRLHVYDETWKLISDRINLLLKNGLGGLVLVVAVLFLFLNSRVAFWVAAGIPISLMGMLGVLLVAGGSINMVSLFAMIMALGIVVDDAIVVGEDAFAHYQMGERSLMAAEGGAQRMFAPVTASMLTTVSAFLPLMLIGGIMGNILFEIPFVMVCVLIASLIECFFVLPGHLRHSFHSMHEKAVSATRQKLEKGFDTFRDVYFRALVVKMIEYRWTLVSFMLATLILTFGLLASGKLHFTFFPSPEGNILAANVNFVAGTSPERVDKFLDHLEDTLYQTEKQYGEKLVNVVISRHGTNIPLKQGGGRSGDQFGGLMIELMPSDTRSVRNKALIRAWQENIHQPPGLESFTISERQAGPPGGDLEIRLIGDNTTQLKAAALELTEKLKTFKGVSGVQDDMPYGREEWIYSLTPLGESLGLTIDDVGRQLRAAFDGYLAQIYQDGDDEMEVRVLLPDEERDSLATLESFNLQLPNGETILFSSAVKVETRRGFEALRHAQGHLAAQVSGDVDSSVNNNNTIISELEASFLPNLASHYSVEYSLEGRAADQAETFADMKRGLLLGVAMMYIILAWQFASYGWPLVVMAIIPFGLVGAITGHWLTGLDLTILSLFGFFGLSGIVVNDSIVLVTFYRHLREGGMPVSEALVEAACQRLRAVLLTSLTTIFGLMPLLFETSLQAQFLIPMATSISFGLMFSTFLVLLAVPTLLSFYESVMVGKGSKV